MTSGLQTVDGVHLTDAWGSGIRVTFGQETDVDITADGLRAHFWGLNRQEDELELG